MKTTMASQEHCIASIRNIETQVVQIAKQLAEEPKGAMKYNCHRTW